MSGYYFSPLPITSLTKTQQAALNESGPLALSGGPGTGKSVVSLLRHIRNHEQGKNSLLLTYTQTLMRYLKSYANQYGSTKTSRNIGTFYAGRPLSRGCYDEIIIDEAQDVDPDMHRTLTRLGYEVSYGADDSQILYPDHCTRQEELHEIYPDNIEYLLDRNFRSTQNIMLFARCAFPDLFVPQDIIDGLAHNPGPKPVAIWDNHFRSTLKLVRELSSETTNIGILTPWKVDVESMAKYLTDNGIDTSCYISDDTGSGSCESLKNVHVTSYRSAKGLEFDTVILPEFDYFYFLDKPQIREGDKCVLSVEDMYVAVTRARSNLYLINKFNPTQFRRRFDGYIQ